MKDDIKLEFCKLSDPRYQDIRNRHYVENRGCHGQQVHFLIYYQDILSGIISGGSSVYAVKPRDEFFGIPKDKILRQKFYLPSIVNNTVFRIENHVPNLPTCVLAKFRKTMCELWKLLYGVDVIGFETFVVETDYRKGTLYKADNWQYLGETQGSTKQHNGLKNKSTRKKTESKLIYCIKTGKDIGETAYESSWRAETAEQKARKKELTSLRQSLIGKIY